eukprot:gene41123-50170_t
MEKKFDLTVFGQPCKRWPAAEDVLYPLLQWQGLWVDKHDVRLLLPNLSSDTCTSPEKHDFALGYDGDDDVDLETLQEERYRDDVKSERFQSERESSKLERERALMLREAKHLSSAVGLALDEAVVAGTALKDYRVLLHTARRVREQGVALEVLLKTLHAPGASAARSLDFLDERGALHGLYEQLKQLDAAAFWELYMRGAQSSSGGGSGGDGVLEMLSAYADEDDNLRDGEEHDDDEHYAALRLLHVPAALQDGLDSDCDAARWGATHAQKKQHLRCLLLEGAGA